MYQMKTPLYKRKPAKPKRTGVVEYWLHSSSGPEYAPYELHNLVNTGLPLKELEDLQASLRMPMEKLVPKLAMSKATYHRRKASGKLDPAESDRVVRFA